MVDFNFSNNFRGEREPQRTKREGRLDRIRDAHGVKHVRVEVIKEGLEEHLRHPSHDRRGGFQAEWPNDTFTHRRIRDGDIRLAEDQRNLR
jgi:hypothetical protein